MCRNAVFQFSNQNLFREVNLVSTYIFQNLFFYSLQKKRERCSLAGWFVHLLSKILPMALIIIYRNNDIELDHNDQNFPSTRLFSE